MTDENKYKLVYWCVRTDSGEYTVSEEEMEQILMAENANSRFVKIGGVVFNTAFIKDIVRKAEVKDIRYSAISEKDKKYLAKEDRKLLK